MRSRTIKREAAEQSANELFDAMKPDCCEFCGQRGPTEVHHVAGRIGSLLGDDRFILFLDRDCHMTIEERILGADSVACGLALLRKMGRGSVSQYWTATGRCYPPMSLVERWSRRIRSE